MVLCVSLPLLCGLHVSCSTLHTDLQTSPQKPNRDAGLQDLCEGFWQQDSPCMRALASALDDARDHLFPAAPAPLLRMLTALAADSGTALYTAQYLRALRGVAAVHDTSNGVAASNGSKSTVVAAKAFSLPGLPIVTIPQVRSLATVMGR